MSMSSLTRRYCNECGKEVFHKDTSIMDGVVRHERCAKKIFEAIKKKKIAEAKVRNEMYYQMLRKHKGLRT